ncbi:hypothetical protein [Yersinia wautersii]|uniref:hypothetical protein n=1 Tax=Yersinia wautersii TaxID=1341643 RepID=UPI000421FC32|nr:hypothetical protein [Yersinia wautersii]
MWRTTVIALLVLFRITTGHAGMITLSNEKLAMTSVQLVLSTYIGADNSKIGDVITDVGVLSSYYSKEYAHLIQPATNSAYQCELADGFDGYTNDIKLQVRKLQAGYAGEATCVIEVAVKGLDSWMNSYTNFYVYNAITAPSEYGPSSVTIMPSGTKVKLPNPWSAWGPYGQYHSWQDHSYFSAKAVKWSATYDEQIQHHVSKSNPYVPILTVTDDSNIWAYVTATTKDVDAGFTTAVRITMPDGRSCSRGMGAGEQCFMYVDKDKLRPGTTKGQIVLNIQLP